MIYITRAISQCQGQMFAHRDAFAFALRAKIFAQSIEAVRLMLRSAMLRQGILRNGMLRKKCRAQRKAGKNAREHFSCPRLAPVTGAAGGMSVFAHHPRRPPATS